MTSVKFIKEDWQKGYQSLRAEQAYWIENIEGELPQELEGTLFRNGPGLQDVNGQTYGHPFDGDGMVCAIAFKQGKAHFANKFVKTPEFLAEQEAGRILYRGVFGTQKPGGWWKNALDLKFKGVANTNVIYHGKKLLALWEASLPYRLDPQTLDTLGVENFGQALAPGRVFTAHPRLDPQTGNLWAFGVVSGSKSTALAMYCVDAAGSLQVAFKQKIPGFCFLHDFAYTSNYRIFAQNPVVLNSLPFVLGLKPAGACIDLKPNTPTKFLVFDRGGNLITLLTEPNFIFHHCNAFERGDEIILDSVCYDTYPKLEPNVSYLEVDFDKVIPGQLWRSYINLKEGTVKREVLVARSCEFPAIHPRCVGQSYRYAYLGATDRPTGNAPLQAILKIDLQTGIQTTHSFAPRGFVGEPVFVPRSNRSDAAEDDGWVIAIVFDAAANRSDVVVLDATNLAADPIATLHLKHHIPYGLHGNFTPETWAVNN